jgi:hypothetical protein
MSRSMNYSRTVNGASPRSSNSESSGSTQLVDATCSSSSDDSPAATGAVAAAGSSSGICSPRLLSPRRGFSILGKVPSAAR